MELGRLLTRYSLTRLEVSLMVSPGFLLPASCETCQSLEFPLNRLRAQSRVGPVEGLLPLVSGLSCFGMAFLLFLMKQLCHCNSVVIASFVGTGHTREGEEERK
jgi:hypothetical protein